MSHHSPNGWPQFSSPADLLADRWGDYITAVYGEIPASRDLYPWCKGNLWMYYESVLTEFNVTDIPPIAAECPADANVTLNQTGVEGQRYAINNPLQPYGISWSWHNPQPDKPTAPQSPIPNNTWVEVMHRKVDYDEKTGAWLFYAPGSGIWFNLGRTIVFESHGQAFEHFNATFAVNSTHNNPLCINNVNITTTNECMSHVATLQGYDSIQFMDTWPLDCTYNKTIVTRANMNYEFVAVGLQGYYACISEWGDSPKVRSGWRGNRPCTCFENRSKTDNLNCREVPQ